MHQNQKKMAEKSVSSSKKETSSVKKGTQSRSVFPLPRIHESGRNGRKETESPTPHIDPPPLPACEECYQQAMRQQDLIKGYVELLSSVKEEFIITQLAHFNEDDMWIHALEKLQTVRSESPRIHHPWLEHGHLRSKVYLQSIKKKEIKSGIAVVEMTKYFYCILERSLQKKNNNERK